MTTQRSRAWRRNQLNKRKKQVVHYDTCPVKTPDWIGRVATTPKPCSCWMCGNPRKLGELTRQEALADLPDELCIGYTD